MRLVEKILSLGKAEHLENYPLFSAWTHFYIRYFSDTAVYCSYLENFK